MRQAQYSAHFICQDAEFRWRHGRAMRFAKWMVLWELDSDAVERGCPGAPTCTLRACTADAGQSDKCGYILAGSASAMSRIAGFSELVELQHTSPDLTALLSRWLLRHVLLRDVRC